MVQGGVRDLPGPRMEAGKVLGYPIQTAVRIGPVKGKGTEWKVKVQGSKVQRSGV